ncbi:MAG: NAD-dependent epimerase/dehydratase family protein [Burkholderiales bacterium]|nr:NAD-dependent epimerase/dehydratase family protein [Burkholderiales bacterium]
MTDTAGVVERPARQAQPEKRPRHDRGLVLVTGSTGALGSRLAAALGESFEIVGLDLRCDGADHECHAVDLTSDESLRTALGEIERRHGRRIASVIHLAAYYDLSGAPNPLYDRVNVEGTRRLLRALGRFGVEQFVYASTMLVHAPSAPGVPIAEDSPLEAKWAYPQSKLAAEEALRAEHGAVPLVLLRIAGVYTDRCGSPFLAHQIQRIYERRLTGSVYAGDAARGQSFIHIDDLVELVQRVVEKRGELPDELALLAGEPSVMTYEALQNQLALLLHGESGWRTHELPKPLAKAGAWLREKTEPLVPDALDRGETPFVKPYMADLSEDHYELDVSRARALVGWTPRHSLRESVPGMVEALKRDPLAWYDEHKLVPPPWLATARERAVDVARLYAEHDAARREAHYGTQWAHFINIGLGAWLATSPATLGYGDSPMAANDLACGLAVMVLAFLSLSWRMGWARLATGAVGLWLLFAPLVFRAPSAAGYLNDTLVGALILALAVVIPPMPGVGPVASRTGPDIPPGWDYSPSDWLQRLPIIALAFVGLFVSRYLAAYQLGHTPQAWDPFFGAGTERIITSSVSKAWPVPDAGLGAVTYMLEILTGLIGGRNRWRTMPWLVVAFGIMIVPLGAVSVFFIVIQPIVIGTWCALCLVAAAAMLLQIPYSFDELVATGQFLVDRARKGKSVLRVFLFGDTTDGDRRSAEHEFAAPVRAVLRGMLAGGVGVPWTLAASAAIGVWLMCTRLAFDTAGAQAHSDHLLGSLIVTVSIAALAEVARPLRFVNMVFGVALIGAPWMLDGGSLLADWAGALAGAALIALSVPRGAVRSRYGSWNRYIF